VNSSADFDKPSFSRRSSQNFTAPITSIVASGNSRPIVLLSNGTALQIKGNSSTPLSGLSRVSHVGVSGNFIAAVSHQATLNLIGPRLNYAIPFFGDAITCCAVSKTFRIAACATVSGMLSICSLFEGTKTRTVSLGDGFDPLKILITESFGFILTYASLTEAGKTSFHLFLHTVNGVLIRTVKIENAIDAWCTWASRDSFDFVMVATGGDLGKLWIFEAFYLELGECLDRCRRQVVSVAYLTDLSVGVAITSEGKAFFVPYPV
jgi:hypothetical protein